MQTCKIPSGTLDFTGPSLTTGARARTIDQPVAYIGARYGPRTARVARLELEYPETNSRSGKVVAAVHN